VYVSAATKVAAKIPVLRTLTLTDMIVQGLVVHQPNPHLQGRVENVRLKVGRPENDRPNCTKNGRDEIGRPQNG